MKRLVLAATAAAACALTQPAQAQTQCWWGPLGVLRNCASIGPIAAPYMPLPPYSYGGYEFDHDYGPYWRY